MTKIELLLKGESDSLLPDINNGKIDSWTSVLRASDLDSARHSAQRKDKGWVWDKGKDKGWVWDKGKGAELGKDKGWVWDKGKDRVGVLDCQCRVVALQYGV